MDTFQSKLNDEKSVRKEEEGVRNYQAWKMFKKFRNFSLYVSALVGIN